MAIKKWQRLKKNVNNYLFDHTKVKATLDYTYGFILAAVSAFAFAFGYCCFIIGTGPESPTFVTGGVSGLSQTLISLIKLIFPSITMSDQTFQSILYFAINIPILIFAFRKVGIRFAIFTLVDVALSSLFIRLFDLPGSFTAVIANNSFVKGNMVLRALLGGVTIGFSSAVAFKGFFSAGGIDVVTYFVSLKKSTTTGKFNLSFNVLIITSYFIIALIKDPSRWDDSLLGVLFSCLYLVIVSLVIDLINVRNKKVQIQIVTTSFEVNENLIANFPHGVTILKGEGGYSHQDKYVLLTTVSSVEVKKVIKVVQACDPRAFIDIYPVSRVVGNFFIKPIE